MRVCYQRGLPRLVLLIFKYNYLATVLHVSTLAIKVKTKVKVKVKVKLKVKSSKPEGPIIICNVEKPVLNVFSKISAVVTGVAKMSKRKLFTGSNAQVLLSSLPPTRNPWSEYWR